LRAAAGDIIIITIIVVVVVVIIVTAMIELGPVAGWLAGWLTQKRHTGEWPRGAPSVGCLGGGSVGGNECVSVSRCFSL